MSKNLNFEILATFVWSVTQNYYKKFPWIITVEEVVFWKSDFRIKSKYADPTMTTKYQMLKWPYNIRHREAQTFARLSLWIAIREVIGTLYFPIDHNA